jgi:hypothetical protein
VATFNIHRGGVRRIALVSGVALLAITLFRTEGDVGRIRKDHPEGANSPSESLTPRAAIREPLAAKSVIAPWESTPRNTPNLGVGYLPAWKVKPPAPEPLPVPTVPAATSDPQSNQPPLFNPGGVNGTRPPRTE